MRIGYFAQHTVESLLAGHSPIDHLRELSPEGTNQAFRDFLGKWNFAGDRAFESIDSFSGGEKARLALALIRSEENTSELQSLLRISYAVFCLNTKTKIISTYN